MTDSYLKNIAYTIVFIISLLLVVRFLSDKHIMDAVAMIKDVYNKNVLENKNNKRLYQEDIEPAIIQETSIIKKFNQVLERLDKNNALLNKLIIDLKKTIQNKSKQKVK